MSRDKDNVLPLSFKGRTGLRVGAAVRITNKSSQPAAAGDVK